MHRGVTSGRPTSAHPDEAGVIDIADIDLAARHVRALDLRVTTEAEVHIALGEQFRVN